MKAKIEQAAARLNFIELGMAIQNALALLDLMSEQLADLTEEDRGRHCGERASGMIGLACDTEEKLMASYDALYDQYRKTTEQGGEQ